MKMKTQQLKTCEMQQNSSKREVYSKTILPQATKETSNKQPNPTTKATKREQNPHKVSRRKSSRSEQLINEKEMKETIEKINKN